ncbi:hypothetical protein VM1G_11594 [Cytospora mali]|uniref:Uncharacterized protein n=1 Tax=Cytospora mali TaxID=578113 RepID=A0A194W0V3_CYTMA|nr:hypothetical protein VM1G_11594 [Valsa mali]
MRSEFGREHQDGFYSEQRCPGPATRYIRGAGIPNPLMEDLEDLELGDDGKGAQLKHGTLQWSQDGTLNTNASYHFGIIAHYLIGDSTRGGSSAHRCNE